MQKLSTTAKSQVSYMKAHRGKMIGSGLGVMGGIIYAMSGKKDNMMVAGIAILGAVAGGILGGMFDSKDVIMVGVDADGNPKAVTANPNDDQAMSNAIGSFNDSRFGMKSKMTDSNDSRRNF